MRHTNERATALILQNQIDEAITQYGVLITYTRGSGASAKSQDVRARVSPMTTVVRYQWFKSDETVNWELPAYVVTFAGDFRPQDTEPQVEDTVTLLTGNYTVRKWEKSRLGDTVIRTTLYVARDTVP
jgi:hypothetical protein